MLEGLFQSHWIYYTAVFNHALHNFCKIGEVTFNWAPLFKKCVFSLTTHTCLEKSIHPTLSRNGALYTQITVPFLLLKAIITAVMLHWAVPCKSPVHGCVYVKYLWSSAIDPVVISRSDHQCSFSSVTGAKETAVLPSFLVNNVLTHRTWFT